MDKIYIKKLIAEDRLQEVLHILIDAFSEGPQSSEILIFNARHTDLIKQTRLGTISSDSAILEKNQLRRSILEFIEQLDSSFTSEIIEHKKNPQSVSDSQLIPVEVYNNSFSEVFFGRKKEIKLLKSLVALEKIKIIAILGIGGIGKTSLAKKAINVFSSDFNKTIWISFEAPIPLKNVYQKITGDYSYVLNSLNLQKKICDIISEKRYLIVFDNFESLLQQGKAIGHYKDEYKEYEGLIQKISYLNHKSCVIITSREKPHEIDSLNVKEGTLSVINLGGIDLISGKKILKNWNVEGTDISFKKIVTMLYGNPLSLKLTSNFILEIFSGNVENFLKHGKVLSNNISNLIGQHFSRTIDEEKLILFWLAISKKPQNVLEIEECLSPFLGGQFLDILYVLKKRALIEVTVDKEYFLQPVIAEYLTEKLISIFLKELKDGEIDFFNKIPLLRTDSEEYLKNSQLKDFIIPLCLNIQKEFGSMARIEKKLAEFISMFKEKYDGLDGYFAGNLINICYNFGFNLSNFNFSNQSIWFADFKNKVTKNLDLSGCKFNKSLFNDIFTIVYGVDISSDNNFLAAGMANGEVWVWEINALNPKIIYTEHNELIYCVSFSPSGNIIATSSADGRLRIWNYLDGYTFKTLNLKIRSLKFSPNGSFLIAGSEEGDLFCIETKFFSIEKKLTNKISGKIRAIEFIDQNRFAVAGSDQIIRVCSFNDEEILIEDIYQGHERSVWALAYCQKTKFLFSSGTDGKLVRWDILKKNKKGLIVTSQKNRLRCLSVNNEGLIASGGEDQIIKIWKTDTLECTNIIQEHTNWVTGVKFTLDKKGVLISCGEDFKIVFSDLNTNSQKKNFTGYSNWATCMVNVKNKIFIGCEDGNLRIVNSENFTLLDSKIKNHGQILAIDTDKNNSYVAFGGTNNTIGVWNLSSQTLYSHLKGHDNWIRDIEFHPYDSNILISGSFDSKILAWDIRRSKIIKEYKGNKSRVRTLAFYPDGNFIVSGNGESQIMIWDYNSEKLLKIIEGHEKQIRAIEVSPSGEFFASGSHDCKVKIWDSKTGKLFKEFNEVEAPIWCISISENNNFIAIGGEAYDIKIWDIQNNLSHSLIGHTSRVRTLKFLNDNYLVSGCDDGTIKIWNIKEAQCKNTIELDRPYEGMRLTNSKGLIDRQIQSLIKLGVLY